MYIRLTIKRSEGCLLTYRVERVTEFFHEWLFETIVSKVRDNFS